MKTLVKTSKTQRAETTKSGFLRFASVILFAFLGFNLAGQPVNSEKALEVAKNFYNSGVFDSSSLKSAKTTGATIAVAEKAEINNNSLKSAELVPAYYIINYSDNSGFVIVAGDERANPILGYSFTGNYTSENVPEEMAGFLENYKNEIQQVAGNVTLNNIGANKGWDELLYGGTKSAEVSTRFNLINTAWGQGKNFNDLCPQDAAIVSAAYAGRVPSGCVSVVMAQIMKYWSWPVSGTGSRCYTPASHQEYGEQCADFSATTYNWSNMPETVSGTNSDVAQVIYQSAVAVKMNFSPSGSFAYNSAAATAFKEFFGYSQKAEFVSKDNYSNDEWIALMKKHLDNGIPVYYTGNSTSSKAHAFICDGYDQDNRFHFNWGWEGRYDGYFTLDAIAPAGTYNYSSNQGAIINLFPEKTDIAIDAITIESTSAKSGETVQINYSQVFTGIEFNNVNTNVGFYLSKDGMFDSNDILLGEETTVVSSENPVVTSEIAVTLSATSEEGSYYIIAVADNAGSVAETNESNNTKSATLTIGQDQESNSETVECSDILEPNNSSFNAYNIGKNASYTNSSLCLSANDADWFVFQSGSKTFFVKVEAGSNSKGGSYGIEFLFNNNTFEIATYEVSGSTDTKIGLYDEDLTLLAENDNDGNSVFSALIYRELSFSTAATYFTDADFKIYPNPAKEKVYINTEVQFDNDITVTLMDMRGSVLEQRTFNNVFSSSEYSIDLTPYTDGQYIVRINSADGASVTKKLIKNNLI